MSKAPHGLALLDRAGRLLEQAGSLDDLVSVRDAAEAARAFVKAARLGLDLQNKAAELKLRAERKAGTFLAGLQLRGGDRRSKPPRVALKLDDLGISKRQSELWQLTASVPDQDFEQYIASTRQLGQELTAAGLRRIARSQTPRPRPARRPAPARTSRSPINSPMNADRAELLAILGELKDHSELLASLLAPLEAADRHDFAAAERRHIVRLATEIRDTLGSLRKTLWQSGAEGGCGSRT